MSDVIDHQHARMTLMFNCHCRSLSNDDARFRGLFHSCSLIIILMFKRNVSQSGTNTVCAVKTTTSTDYVMATGAGAMAAASTGAAINSAMLGSPLALVYHSGVALVTGAYAVSTFFSNDSDETSKSKSTNTPAKPVAVKSDAPKPDASAPAAA